MERWSHDRIYWSLQALFSIARFLLERFNQGVFGLAHLKPLSRMGSVREQSDINDKYQFSHTLPAKDLLAEY